MTEKLLSEKEAHEDEYMYCTACEKEGAKCTCKSLDKSSWQWRKRKKKINRDHINALIYEHIFGVTVHNEKCKMEQLYFFKDVSFGHCVGCRNCNEEMWLSDFVGDANHTKRVRDKVAEKLNAEWLYNAKRWTLRRYENQFPVVLACCPYEDEGVEICMTALTAVMGDDIELEDDDDGIS